MRVFEGDADPCLGAQGQIFQVAALPVLVVDDQVQVARTIAVDFHQDFHAQGRVVHDVSDLHQFFIVGSLELFILLLRPLLPHMGGQHDLQLFRASAHVPRVPQT